MHKLVISFIILVFISLGCIQELEVFDKASNILVVYGELTNTSEPKVWVSYTTIYNTPIDYSEIQRSEVSILDDQGNKTPMEYIEYGRFITEGFQALVGRTYQLEIIFPDGKKYYSIEQEMLSVPEVEGVKYTLEEDYLRFYASFQDPANVDDFYRWRYRGTYENFSEIAYELRNSTNINLSRNCYYWDVQPDFSKVFNCWASDYDEEYLQVISDFSFDGRFVADQELFSILLDRKFNYGYSMLISLQSMSEEAFNYWEDISDQLGNNGTIFETANYQVVGNIRSADNPSETVLGYFTVSAEKSERIFIDEFMDDFGPIPCIPNDAGCYPKRCVDCRAYGNNSLPTPPDFWPEEYLNDLPL